MERNNLPQTFYVLLRNQTFPFLSFIELSTVTTKGLNLNPDTKIYVFLEYDQKLFDI